MNLKDIIFTPQHTEEQLSQAVSWLQDAKVKATFAYAANFMILAKAGQSEKVNQPCHREISYDNRVGKALVATECGWGRRRWTIGAGNEDLFRPFFDYLTKESFAKDFFLYADIRDGFVVSSDIFAPLLQNIMIMTRHFYEVHEDGFKTFNDMVAKGISGDIAYPLCFNSSLSVKSLPNSKFSSHYSHRVTHLFNLEAMRKFLGGDVGAVTKPFINDPQHHYRNRADYLGGRNIFWDAVVTSYVYAQDYGLVAEVLAMPEFREALSTYRKVNNATAYTPPNPFAPKPVGLVVPSEGEISNQEAVDVLAPFLQTFFS